jgi:hypothetical protein
MWLREDGTPYYVGKGCRGRAFAKHSLHRPPKSRILIQYWESEDAAFEMEKWWINFWGRKDLGTGILRNLTAGGDAPDFETCSKGGRANVASGQMSKMNASKTFEERSKNGRLGGLRGGHTNAQSGHMQIVGRHNWKINLPKAWAAITPEMRIQNARHMHKMCAERNSYNRESSRQNGLNARDTGVLARACEKARTVLRDWSKAGKVGGPMGMHVRWHVNRGVINSDCSFCVSHV